MKDFTEFGIGYSNSFIFLNDDFDPTGTEGGIPLPGNQSYSFNNVEFGYTSNQAKVFAFEAEGAVGEFFNGNRFSLGGEAVLRIQPKVRLSLNVNYDRIALPDPYPVLTFGW